ncbi:MAG: non-hydrolyzing UDP-N-acetylglucosamine 2-epimerase [Armatimonadota bacterium]
MNVTCVVGARPNFMKMAAILAAAEAHPELSCSLVHTGQHYDERMSTLFFRELGLPAPDIYLGVGSGSQAEQTARVLMAFDEVLECCPPDVVLVVGDVNSTLACALAASKRCIPVAHVEAGLRSGDRTMPEEINRVLTDQISDLLFTTERAAEENLRAEGIPAERIHFVGNVMIDTLLRHRERARQCGILRRLEVRPREYAVCTLHRPSNVDSRSAAENCVAAVSSLARRLPVVWPIHPRTRARLETFGLLSALGDRVQTLDPLGYLEFLALTEQARVVFTDSGGIQEETTVLGVPCITFRENTERPVTITHGTNRLIGTRAEAVEQALDEVLRDELSIGAGPVPEYWDGQAGKRVARTLLSLSLPHR